MKLAQNACLIDISDELETGYVGSESRSNQRKPCSLSTGVAVKRQEFCDSMRSGSNRCHVRLYNTQTLEIKFLFFLSLNDVCLIFV